MKKLCEQPNCKREAKFRAKRADKIAHKLLCAAHAAEKFGKYDVELEGLK